MAPLSSFGGLPVKPKHKPGRAKLRAGERTEVILYDTPFNEQQMFGQAAVEGFLLSYDAETLVLADRAPDPRGKAPRLGAAKPPRGAVVTPVRSENDEASVEEVGRKDEHRTNTRGGDWGATPSRDSGVDM